MTLLWKFSHLRKKADFTNWASNTYQVSGYSLGEYIEGPSGLVKRLTQGSLTCLNRLNKKNPGNLCFSGQHCVCEHTSPIESRLLYVKPFTVSRPMGIQCRKVKKSCRNFLWSFSCGGFRWQGVHKSQASPWLWNCSVESVGRQWASVGPQPRHEPTTSESALFCTHGATAPNSQKTHFTKHS